MEDTKKRDMWSDREIRAMLSVVHEKHIMQLMDSKTKRNKSIFDDIANELKKKDIAKSYVQVRNKFKSLKSDFYKAKRNNGKSGAKRQTSEHFELLDEIFGSRPALQAEGIDVAEMDCENIDIENILMEAEEPSEAQTSEESITVDVTEEKKLRGYKRTRKQSYQKVVESFSKEWKESQQDMLKDIKEHEQSLFNQQKQNHEDLLGKSLQSIEKILEKDREETAKMLKSVLSGMKPVQPTFPYIFHAPQTALMEPSSSNATFGQAPKSSPQDSNCTSP